MILTVAWVGEAPRQGEWVRTDRAGWVYEIVRVERVDAGTLEARTGRSLTLEVTRRKASEKPSSAKLYPNARLHGTDIAGPPAVRQAVAFGPTAVMTDTWVDPTDMRINVRAPRKITGFRSVCPLERYRRQRNTKEISDQHVIAAGRLRRDADHARLGFSANADLGEALFHAAGPRTGFSPLAVQQATSLEEFHRAMAIFPNDNDRHMVVYIVLECNSISAWVKKQTEHGKRRYDEKIELGKLVVLLDLLVMHYGEDLADDMRTGEVLVPLPA
jgi:hypothetical protein